MWVKVQDFTAKRLRCFLSGARRSNELLCGAAVLLMVPAARRLFSGALPNPLFANDAQEPAKEQRESWMGFHVFPDPGWARTGTKPAIRPRDGVTPASAAWPLAAGAQLSSQACASLSATLAGLHALFTAK